MRTVTPRGFVTYDEFTDVYGAKITIRESSSAVGARVWVFTEGGSVDENNGSAHLDLEQAARVRDALDAFIREQPVDAK